ncbi:MAG: hypothetical protein DME23_01105 [Verrucomicrobia bacterium]|nr:MAG: hypothetical protein DME23_01105 [Verrucomicrobiota bacterium]
MEGINPDFARSLLSGNLNSASFDQLDQGSKLGFGGEIVLLPENLEFVYPAILGTMHRTCWLRVAKSRMVRTLARRAISRIAPWLRVPSPGC